MVDLFARYVYGFPLIFSEGSVGVAVIVLAKELSE
jgi:hypothetical protein